MVGFLVFNKVPFECRHFRLVEEWAFRTAPKIKEVVYGICLIVRNGVFLNAVLIIIPIL